MHLDCPEWLPSDRKQRQGISFEGRTPDLHWREPVYHLYASFKEPEIQLDCLTMSLESGLELLSTLKILRVVALEDMEVSIKNEDEKNWVKQNWPRAKVRTEMETHPLLVYDSDSNMMTERVIMNSNTAGRKKIARQ